MVTDCRLQIADYITDTVVTARNPILTRFLGVFAYYCRRPSCHSFISIIYPIILVLFFPPVKRI